MGYMIQYNPEDNRRYLNSTSLAIKRVVTGVLVFAMLMLCIMAARYKDAWLPFLLPGNGHVTQAAFSDLFSDIRDGSYSAESVAAFYKQILTDGQT